MSGAAWSHVALNCRDVDATETFYRDWFGFRRVRAVPTPDGEIVFVRSGAVLLELFPAHGDGTGDTATGATATGDGPHGAGAVRHIAFQTDDVDAFLRRMGAAADLALGPLDFGRVIPGWRTAWLRDPDGVVVEISQGFTDEPTLSRYRTNDVKEPA